MEDNFENIKSIVDNVLGSPKRDYCGNGGWYEYNCPCCTEDNGGTPDDKYNLAVQIDEEGLWAHCWRCGYHGKLSRVIKTYGSLSDVEEYKEELSALKESRFFTLSGDTDSVENILDEEELELPEGFVSLSGKCYNIPAKEYLAKRGVDDFLINKFHIGCIGPYKGKFSNRIVIPSYDMYGDLNYYVARDYTGRNKWKILNPEVDKKKIVFNAGLINWYEPITLVEGPFDHIAVPNSIPLLGKSLDEDCAVYKALVERAKSTINILLDDDAISDAYKMYKFLHSVIPDRIRIIECPDGYDASDYHRDFGRKGIVQLMRTAHKLDDYTLATL